MAKLLWLDMVNHGNGSSVDIAVVRYHLMEQLTVALVLVEK